MNFAILIHVHIFIIRGIIAGSGPLFVSTGITLVYTLGAFLPWRWVCLACASFSALSIFSWTCLPETPTWLVHNGRRDDAQKVEKHFGIEFG